MLSMDEPDHTRLRSIVDEAFRRRAILDMEPRTFLLVSASPEQISSTRERLAGGDHVSFRCLAARRPVTARSVMTLKRSGYFVVARQRVCDANS